MRVVCVNRQMVVGREVGYYLLAEENGKLEHYGVKIETDDGEMGEILNLTVSQSDCLALVAMLARNTVTPVALRDVVDDWL